jgi:uncharacterized protein YjiS (DUF1127 family)
MSADLNIVARALDWLKARIEGANELARLSRADLDYLATDIGLTEADLRHIVPEKGDHSELMDQMMIARGLDPDVVRKFAGSAIHDMEVACARCNDVAGCRAALHDGTAGSRARELCPNNAIMADLLQE